jgi:CRP/FNR family cyclic AMP-dependent transcriptional regulator
MLHAELEHVPFFGVLSKQELTIVAQQVDEVDVEPGRVLAREGEFGHQFFVIAGGTADVVHGAARLRELGPGDFFGELALVDVDRRTATVTATSRMRLLVMTRRSFRAMHRAMPDVHAVIVAAIRERGATTERSTAG